MSNVKKFIQVSELVNANMNSPFAPVSNSNPSYAGNCNMKTLTWSKHKSLAPADNMLVSYHSPRKRKFM
jgi:hypothetical protein